MRVDAAAATHVGRVRRWNEDSFLLGERLAIVADGMGGHAAGEVASWLAVQAFEAVGSEPAAESLVAAAHDANSRIQAEVLAHPEKAGMGTTLTGVALIKPGGVPHWFVFNVGDSRTYRFADGILTQLTVDHAEVTELVAQGRISVEQARHHPLRNVITRALGSEAADPDTWLLPAGGVETFLLCSDGLTGELTDAQIEELLRQFDTAESAANALVEAAVAAGGRDNVTVIVLRPVDAERFDVDTATFPRADLLNGGV